MSLICALAMAAAALMHTEAPSQKPAYTGSITCFSDTAEGTGIAQLAAGILSERAQEKYFSKSFLVSSADEKDGNRLLILILSDEGEKAFATARGPFEETILVVLQRMKRHTGDTRTSIVLQKQDKTNLAEASFDSSGLASLKSFGVLSAAAPPSASPTPPQGK